MKNRIKGIWQVIVQAAKFFTKDKILKLSASLAYYTIFSIGPMMIVIIYIGSIFWEKQQIQSGIYSQVRQLVGEKAALQIEEIISNASVSGNNTLMAIIGIVAMLITATTVFSDIQDSINGIWRLKVKKDQGWIKLLINRLRSFSLIVSIGFIFLVSLVISALVDGLMNHLRELFPSIAIVIFYVATQVVTLLATWLLFAIIFKVLPDAIIRWSDILVGALFTAFLFIVGKTLIGFYIGASDIGSTYGTAGSLVVLLLWVYFSSIILYFGAEFTKAYAVKYGSEIKPTEFSVLVQTVQVESGKANVQENEKDAASTERRLQKEKSKHHGSK